MGGASVCIPFSWVPHRNIARHVYLNVWTEKSSISSYYPQANYLGVADGAQSNWDFLALHIEVQILNFYHAAQYIADAAEAAFPRDEAQCEQWHTDRCHDLKRFLKEMQGLSQQRLSESIQGKLEAAVTYIVNHKQQMKYAKFRAANYPIGSGVTEAACKILVKQRLCQSGMRRKEKGASDVLSFRALVINEQRWEQFWGKVNQYGFPVAAWRDII